MKSAAIFMAFSLLTPAYSPMTGPHRYFST